MPTIITAKKSIESSFTLSHILKMLVRGHERFICHAIVAAQSVGWDEYYVDDEKLQQEFYRIIGGKYIRKKRDMYSDEGTLHSWVVNLPSHLREIQYPYDLRHEFRVKFLTWMINKFGDQTINCVSYAR